MTVGPTGDGFDQQVTFVSVADLDRAEVFYGGLLGLEPVLDQGMCRIFRAAGTAFLGVCHDVDAAGSATGVILTLVTDHVDEWAERVRAAGVEPERGPVYNEQFSIYHLFLRDPDGHLVEIQQFRDPRWPRAD